MTSSSATFSPETNAAPMETATVYPVTAPARYAAPMGTATVMATPPAETYADGAHDEATLMMSIRVPFGGRCRFGEASKTRVVSSLYLRRAQRRWRPRP